MWDASIVSSHNSSSRMSRVTWALDMDTPWVQETTAGPVVDGGLERVRLKRRVTRYPNTNPPTWAKKATPPLSLWPVDSRPMLASKSWYRNQAPRKNQADTRRGMIKSSPNTWAFGYSTM